MNRAMVIAVVTEPPRPGLLQRLGLAMARRRGTIQAVQWAVVLAYLVLVLVPAFLPLPAPDVHMLHSLVLTAQFLFWGIWWPFVILSMFVLGRTWCGVFCPEGALSEWASRRGLGRSVPRWMKWGGWPFVAFVLTTLYGQLVSVYEYPKAALLVLGGSTVAAIAVGLVYGRGKRVWCRHLCPVNGVFSLLARLSPLQFRVDRGVWDATPAARPVDCAPLIDVRRMSGASACHMCGRCAGHRDAVTLAARAPGREVVDLADARPDPWAARLLAFGMLGVALGAFQWSASPWFVSLKQAAAQWLVLHDHYALLGDGAPWWLLTHYPSANDTFSWLDGLCILGYIGATALAVGGWIWGASRVAGGLLAGRGRDNAVRLVHALTPLAGASLFVGLSQLTTGQLRGEEIVFPWANDLRLLLLAAAAAWSLVLVRAMAARLGAGAVRQAGVMLLMLAALAPVPLLWAVQFRVW